MATAKRPGRFESAVEVLILLAVAGMAGAASFTHVHDWTMHNSPTGTGDWFGWANAMVSELIPLAAGLEARRRMRHYGAAGAYPVALIVAAVALSLTGQFAEAKPSVSGWLIAAVPAIGFLALVKLVLSSPATPTTTATAATTVDGVDPDNNHTPHSTGRPAMPSGAIEAVPTHLLASARFAATNHEQATGESITPGELAARISVPTTTAANLLRALHSETPARLNGYAHGTVQ